MNQLWHSVQLIQLIKVIEGKAHPRMDCTSQHVQQIHGTRDNANAETIWRWCSLSFETSNIFRRKTSSRSSAKNWCGKNCGSICCRFVVQSMNKYVTISLYQSQGIHNALGPVASRCIDVEEACCFRSFALRTQDMHLLTCCACLWKWGF